MPTPLFSTRPALPTDAVAIAQVHVASWQAAYQGLLSEAYLQGLTQTVQRRAAFIADGIARTSLNVRVAEQDGEIVGWSSYGRSRDEDAEEWTGELYALYLAPDAWAKGIGRQLWLASRESLKSSGFFRVTLWMLDGNERAERFYLAAGFTPQSTSSRIFEDDGIALPLTRYELRF